MDYDEYMQLRRPTTYGTSIYEHNQKGRDKAPTSRQTIDYHGGDNMEIKYEDKDIQVQVETHTGRIEDDRQGYMYADAMAIIRGGHYAILEDEHIEAIKAENLACYLLMNSPKDVGF